MGNFIKTFGFVVLTLFTVACATKAVGTTAQGEAIPTKAEMLASFSGEELAMGETLFANNCDKCHKLFEPESRDPEKWTRVLKRMLPKTDLTEDEGKLVTAYLIANSK